MRRGEIARKDHVSGSLIRYYERTGILARAARVSFCYHCYEACDLARIQDHGQRRLGCSFAEIKRLLHMRRMQMELEYLRGVGEGLARGEKQGEL